MGEALALLLQHGVEKLWEKWESVEGKFSGMQEAIHISKRVWFQAARSWRNMQELQWEGWFFSLRFRALAASGVCPAKKTSCIYT